MSSGWSTRITNHVRGRAAAILSGDLAAAKKKAGLAYLATDLSPAFVNWLELSSVFPNVEGIEVLADAWKQPVPLADAEAGPAWHFKTRARADNPALRELVPAGPR